MTEDDPKATKPSQPSPPSAECSGLQDSSSLPGEGAASNKHTLYARLNCGLGSNPAARQEVALNKRVGFYKLRSQLGAGSFSKVKLGVHLLTNGRSLCRYVRPLLVKIGAK